MPVKNFFIAKKAEKELSKIPKHVQKRVISALDEIDKNPLSEIKLHGELQNYKKYRVGDYRIIYRHDIKTNSVYIIHIEHRQGVYR